MVRVLWAQSVRVIFKRKLKVIYSDRIKLEFEFVDPCLCSAWVATAIIGSSAIGAIGTAYAASKASDAQQNAAATAANTQLSMYNTTRIDLAPYRNIGGQASDYVSKNLPSLIAPVNVDTSILDDPNSTIGQAYQFINQQGQRGVTNSAAARGLATSGAALKGAATFATKTADTTYNDLFNMGVTNQTNAFNRLQSLINTGENAGAQTGAAGTSAANGASAAQVGAGNAAAAGINATGTAINNVASSVPNAYLTQGLYGKLASSTGPAGPTSVGGLPLQG